MKKIALLFIVLAFLSSCKAFRINVLKYGDSHINKIYHNKTDNSYSKLNCTVETCYDF